MRIALACDWYLPRLGGIERQLSGLASRLAAAGHEVTVFSPTRGACTADPAVRVVALDAWRMPVIGLTLSSFTAHDLDAHLRAGRFDVVHVHGSIASPFGWGTTYMAARAGLPLVYTVHSVWGNWRRWYALLDFLWGWSRYPMLFSAVSERAVADIQPLLPGVEIARIPNGIDPEEWRVPHRPATDAIHIVTVTRLALRKRGEATLRAFAAARARTPATTKLVLHIAGDGSQRRNLERLATTLGVGDAVRFHGAVTSATVRQLLAQSHVFVLPTELESFGLAALEARAVGLPVVAMRTSGVTEFVRHGVEGLLAADDADLAAHLHRLSTDAALRATITRHNRTTPITHTWARALEANLAAYARARALCPPRPVARAV